VGVVQRTQEPPRRGSLRATAGDEALRARFYERLSAYARTLGDALSSGAFIEETPTEKVKRYKTDLKFFMALRTAVRRRYAEVVDFKEYEARIQKLLDTHVGTGAVEQTHRAGQHFDSEAFAREVEKLEESHRRPTPSPTARRRPSASGGTKTQPFTASSPRCSKTPSGRFARSGSRTPSICANVTEICNAVRDRSDDGIPEALRHRDGATGVYRV